MKFMTILEFLLSVQKIPSWDRTPGILNKDLNKLIDQARMLENDKKKDCITHQ